MNQCKDSEKLIYPEQSSVLGNIDFTLDDMYLFVKKTASVIVFILLIGVVLLTLIFTQLLWYCVITPK